MAETMAYEQVDLLEYSWAVEKVFYMVAWSGYNEVEV